MTALEEIDWFKRIMAAYRTPLPRCTRRQTSAGMLRRERSAGCSPSRKAPAAKGSVGVLRRMYELGARMMTLTWNHENELAAPQRNTRRVLVPQTEKGPDREGL